MTTNNDNDDLASLVANLRNHVDDEPEEDASSCDIDEDDDENPPSQPQLHSLSNINNSSKASNSTAESPYSSATVSPAKQANNHNQNNNSFNIDDDVASSDADTIEPDSQDVIVPSSPLPSPPHPTNHEHSSLDIKSSQKKSETLLKSPSVTVKHKHKTKNNPKKRKKRIYSHAPSSPMQGNEQDEKNSDDDSSASSSSYVSSDADTLPPPSPSAIQRVQNDAKDIPMMIINPDEIESDVLKSENNGTINRQVYPKLKSDGFQFKEKIENATDTNLSSLSHKKGDRKFPIKLPEDSGILPANILASLSKYQKDGITFMYRLFERERGGLLGDAMGLGKTVQTICFLGAVYSIWNRPVSSLVSNAPRILIIVPAAVTVNWNREFETWTPFRVDVFHSTKKAKLSRDFRDGLLDVLITGDHGISNNQSFFNDPLGDDYDSDDNVSQVKKNKWKWDVVIIDEVHMAKNSTTKTYKSLQQLSRLVTFGLTGTPIQNDLKELYNVLSLLVPSRYLPDRRRFREYFKKPIAQGTKKNASTYMRQRAEQKIKELRNLLSKHMVRRPKSILDSELPDKTDYCVLMKMKANGVQGYMYRRFQNSYDVKMLRDSKSKCDCGSGELSKECCHRFPSTERSLANAPIWKQQHKDLEPCEKCPNCISFLVQFYSKCISAHSFLLLPEDESMCSERFQQREKALEYYLSPRYSDLLNKPLESIERMPDMSCKLNVALKLIRNYQKNGHKTIIFYESLRLGSILQRWATNKGLFYQVIDGSIQKNLRQIAVDKFNNDKLCDVFFISKKAGGVGLNICGADRVLIFEPCWNPTLDVQAGDRAHRLGQKRGVQMIRFVVENTIEHYILKTAISKTQISNAILDSTDEMWRIRDDEVGSMLAMLSIGEDLFSSEQNEIDTMRRVETTELVTKNKLKRQNQMKEEEDAKENQNNRKNETDDEDFEKRKQVQESMSMDIFGNEAICSLDVDVDTNAWLLKGNDKPEDHINEFDGENNDTTSVVEVENNPNMDIVTDDDSDKSDESINQEEFEESQAVSELLEKGGAAKKMIMVSTRANKKYVQLYGTSSKGSVQGGINAVGPEHLNLDGSQWKPQTSDSDESEQEEDSELLVLQRDRIGRKKSCAIQNKSKPRKSHVSINGNYDEHLEYKLQKTGNIAKGGKKRSENTSKGTSYNIKRRTKSVNDELSGDCDIDIKQNSSPKKRKTAVDSNARSKRSNNKKPMATLTAVNGQGGAQTHKVDSTEPKVKKAGRGVKSKIQSNEASIKPISAFAARARVRR